MSCPCGFPELVTEVGMDICGGAAQSTLRLLEAGIMPQSHHRNVSPPALLPPSNSVFCISITSCVFGGSMLWKLRCMDSGLLSAYGEHLWVLGFPRCGSHWAGNGRLLLDQLVVSLRTGPRPDWLDCSVSMLTLTLPQGS